MRILGLTGSIGMGKSTAASMLRRMSIPVHASDEAVHKLLGKNGKAVVRVAKLFPPSHNKKNNSIDRKVLGAAVFANKALLKKLEAILHPLVRAEERAFLKRCKALRRKVVVLDIPLLYETGAEKRVHQVMVVSAPKDVQTKRVLSRKGMTAKKFKTILKHQLPDAEKRKRADIIIPTGRGLAVTRAHLKAFIGRN